METLKLGKALRMLVPLLGFMLLIYIGYSLLLKGPLKQHRMASIQGAGVELQQAREGLDGALRHIDSAMLRLEAGKIGLLSGTAKLDARDSLIARQMDSTLDGLEALQERMYARKIALDSLIHRAESLR